MLLITASAAVASANPPSGPKGTSNVALLLLISKAPGTFEEIWPEAFGRLKYQSSYAGVFTAQLGLHRVGRATWYLVTLQRPAVGSPDPNPFAGSTCLFGGPQGPGFGLDSWCDLALVKTNRGGNASIVIPALPSVTLASGTYANLTMAIKNVGCNQNCSAPDPVLLAADGNGELYKSEPLAFAIEQRLLRRRGTGSQTHPESAGHRPYPTHTSIPPALTKGCRATDATSV